MGGSSAVWRYSAGRSWRHARDLVPACPATSRGVHCLSGSWVRGQRWRSYRGRERSGQRRGAQPQCCVVLLVKGIVVQVPRDAAKYLPKVHDAGRENDASVLAAGCFPRDIQRDVINGVEGQYRSSPLGGIEELLLVCDALAVASSPSAALCVVPQKAQLLCQPNVEHLVGVQTNT